MCRSRRFRGVETVLENRPPIGWHGFSSNLICQKMPPVLTFPPHCVNKSSLWYFSCGTTTTYLFIYNTKTFLHMILPLPSHYVNIYSIQIVTQFLQIILLCKITIFSLLSSDLGNLSLKDHFCSVLCCK